MENRDESCGNEGKRYSKVVHLARGVQVQSYFSSTDTRQSFTSEHDSESSSGAPAKSVKGKSYRFDRAASISGITLPG